VAQRVGTDAVGRRARGRPAADQSIDAADGQTPAAEVDEQRAGWARTAGRDSLPLPPVLRVPSLHEDLAILQVRANRLRRTVVERHDPLFAALAEHADHPGTEIHIVDVETAQLAEAESGRVEQLENRAVAAAERRVVGRGGDERVHLALG